MSSSAAIAARTAPPPHRAAGLGDGAPRRGDRWVGGVGLVLAALIGFAAWVPFLHAPLSADESGFLLLGRQLARGTSLYGNYWVDRPPLLLWLFGLAAHLGPVQATAVGTTAPGVKLLGAIASGTSILFSGVLAGLVAPAAHWARRAAVVLAMLLLSSPLIGMPETDGELLALPFVLAGLACLAAVLRRPHGRRVVLLAAVAGASGAAAALIKQNVLDVFVVAIVLALARRRREPRLHRWLPAFAGGAVAVVVAALAVAAVQGTSPTALWDAVVVFRWHAATVIGSSASAATTQRLLHLLRAFAVSGAAAVLVAGVVLLAPRRTAARWPVLALVVWELCGIAAGGSYWLHYLTGLVPGLVLLATLAPGTGRWRQRVVAVVLAYVAVMSAVGWARQVAAPAHVTPDAQVATYLRDHADRADGVVVAFGHPDIVAGSGLSSPYPQLWSLPVRVDDPRLAGFDRALAGPRAPRWIVVSGQSVASWGVDARAAQRTLHAHYVEEARFGEWHIWQREGGMTR
jgi:hypothetical protein